MNALWDGFMDFLPGNWDLFKEWVYWEFLLREPLDQREDRLLRNHPSLTVER